MTDIASQPKTITENLSQGSRLVLHTSHCVDLVAPTGLHQSSLGSPRVNSVRPRLAQEPSKLPPTANTSPPYNVCISNGQRGSQIRCEHCNIQKCFITQDYLRKNINIGRFQTPIILVQLTYSLSYCFQSLRLVCSSSHELLILGISVRIF
jgi:hypothetical protein